MEAPKRTRTKAEDWVPIVPVPHNTYDCVEGEPRPPHLAWLKAAPSASWPYFDVNGELTAFRLRFDDDKGKHFSPLTYCRNRETGQTEWRARDLLPPRGLYGLEMITSDPNKILIVEGEKACDAARRLLPEWCCLTWPDGARAVIGADWLPVRKLPETVRIVLWPDNDRPGERAMSEVASSIGRRVTIVQCGKDWPGGYDLADLEQDGWTTAQVLSWIADNAQNLDAPKESRIQVSLGQDDLANVRELSRALDEAKAPLYRVAPRSLLLIKRDEQDGTITERVNIEDATDLIAAMVPYVSGRVSERTAQGFLLWGRIPRLDLFSECPLMGSDGAHETYGYHPSIRSFIVPAPGYRMVALEEAWDLVDDLLADFPLKSTSDRTHAILFPLTVIMRPLIHGPTPLFRFDGSQPRIGKGTICKALSYVVSTPDFATLPKTDEELEKRIGSIIKNRPSVVVFDNVKSFETETLKAVLTAERFSTRKLGANEDLSGQMLNAWACTVNNTRAGTEIVERSIRVRLELKAGDALPGDRPPSEFRHEFIVDYVRANRGLLQGAFMAMAKAALDMNGGSKPRVNLGGFESWVANMSAVADANSLEGLLGTKEIDRLEAVDDTVSGFVEFVEAWEKRFGDSPVVAGDLAPLASGLPLAGKARDDGSYSASTIGRILSRSRGMIVENKKIENGKSHGTRWWRLAGAAPAAPQDEDQALF